MPAPHSWYLVRTKSKRENYVRDQLSSILAEAFLPMVGQSVGAACQMNGGGSAGILRLIL
jgi:transcription antitermination factor NusG